MLPRLFPSLKRTPNLQRIPGRQHPVLLHLRRAAELWRVLGWGFALWLAAVAVPMIFLFPEAGLDQRVCQVLAAIAPVAMLLTALSGEATAVLGAGLGGLLPILIACPALQGPRTTGAAQGLLIAVLILGLFAVAWNHAGLRDFPGGALRRLARWPTGRTDRLVRVLGLLWLALAWQPPGGDDAEAQRAVRVAGVAVCWVAVRLVPLAGPPPSDIGRDRWPLRAARRLVWLALLGGLYWLWRRSTGGHP